MSSGVSPTPMNLTGILIVSRMAMTMRFQLSRKLAAIILPSGVVV